MVAETVGVKVGDAAPGEGRQLLHERPVHQDVEATGRHRAVFDRPSVQHHIRRMVGRRLDGCGQRHLTGGPRGLPRGHLLDADRHLIDDSRVVLTESLDRVGDGSGEQLGVPGPMGEWDRIDGPVVRPGERAAQSPATSVASLVGHLLTLGHVGWGHLGVGSIVQRRGAGNVARVRSRRCSRTGCQSSAVQTLTYVYGDSTAVLGPLATRAEPHSYDLCRQHSTSLSAPRGWEVIRLIEPETSSEPSGDDLLALANAVREVGLAQDDRGPGPELSDDVVEVGRRGHLRLLADADVRWSETHP